MTLFPWPEHSDALLARPSVLWKRTDSPARGLLTDSPAVPLQFSGELHTEEPVQVLLTGADDALVQKGEALHRVRHVEQLLAIREPRPR
jgi:hypothetical protein